MTKRLNKTERKIHFRAVIRSFLLVLALLTIVTISVAKADVFNAPVISTAGLHDDYYRGNWWSWQSGNTGSVGISGIDCYGGCYWSGDKTYNEFMLPAISGNILSATFYVNVTGGSGDAWLNALSTTGLTGDVNADQNKLPWSFNNGGSRIQTGGAIGWVGLDVTSGVQADYAAGLTYAAFTLDPVPWATSLPYSDFTTGSNAPYLQITTDAVTPDPPGASVPEPATMLLLGFGLTGIAGLRRKFSN